MTCMVQTIGMQVQMHLSDLYASALALYFYLHYTKHALNVWYA